MNEIVCQSKRWRITSQVSQTVWAFMLLELAHTGKLPHGSGSVMVADGTAELSRWYVENYGNALWRITITTDLPNDGRVTNVWEGNHKCFYPVN